MKTVTYTGAARRSLKKLPETVQTDIRAKLARYAESGQGDVKQLQGREGLRLRVGDFRVILMETIDTIEIHVVGHRRDIYR